MASFDTLLAGKAKPRKQIQGAPASSREILSPSERGFHVLGPNWQGAMTNNDPASVYDVLPVACRHQRVIPGEGPFDVAESLCPVELMQPGNPACPDRTTFLTNEDLNPKGPCR